MKTFTTAVCLTEKQFMDLTATLYQTDNHYKNLSRNKWSKITNDLFLLLTLPVGSEVYLHQHHERASECFTLQFEDGSSDSGTVLVTAGKDETSIPADLAMLFLLSKKFWDFKLAIWSKWKISIGKPIQEYMEDQLVDAERAEVLNKISSEELAAFITSRVFGRAMKHRGQRN